MMKATEVLYYLVHVQQLRSIVQWYVPTEKYPNQGADHCKGKSGTIQSMSAMNPKNRRA